VGNREVSVVMKKFASFGSAFNACDEGYPGQFYMCYACPSCYHTHMWLNKESQKPLYEGERSCCSVRRFTWLMFVLLKNAQGMSGREGI
jgi:hypothetical protein